MHREREHKPKLKELHFPAVFSKVEIDFAGAGITGSGGQDDFFTMNPHLLNGIDVSQVQDIGKLYDASFLKPNFFVVVKMHIKLNYL